MIRLAHDEEREVLPDGLSEPLDEVLRGDPQLEPRAALSVGLLLEPGDLLVLFSDGITEAENPKGLPFEESGIEQVLASTTGQQPEAIGRALLAAAERHAGDARLSDDLTALVVQRRP